METSSPLYPLDLNTLPNRQSILKPRTTEKPFVPPLAIDCSFSDERSISMPESTTESLPPPNRPSLTGQPSFQRPKKRITWRNKVCTIALPLENEHGRTTSRTDYLKPQDVKDRLKAWKGKGFDTNGFILTPPSTESTHPVFQGQSRAIYPDDDQQERSQHSYRVNIPDLRTWEVHVSKLKEEKLRALGVTFRDEEPPSGKSPAPSLMSRQASSQSSTLLASPSVQTFAPPAPFGASYDLTATQSGKHVVSHFPRYSIASPFGEKSLPHPTLLSVSQSPAVHNGIPSAYASSHSDSRVGSPSINEQPAHNLRPPALHPMTNGITETLNQSSFDQLSPLRQPQSLPQVHSVQYHQDSLDPQPAPQVDFSKSSSSQSLSTSANHQAPISVVTPSPRRHHQNLSESLQRDIQEAELFRSETERHGSGIQKIQASAENIADEGGKVALSSELANPKTLCMDDYDQAHEAPARVKLSSSNHDPIIEKTSTSPISSNLNVNAPEFTFKSKSSFNPDMFTFLPDQSSTSVGVSGVSPQTESQAHSRKQSASRSLTKLNAAAPAFTPGVSNVPKPNVPSRVFSFGSTPATSAHAELKSEAQSREFSFSSNATTFNPDAPTFKPRESSRRISNASSHDGSASRGGKIFKNISFTDIIKPIKKSKALPIVHPKVEDESEQDLDGPEDESGRITQSDARQKRMRHAFHDGDQVPQFAIPQSNSWPDTVANDHFIRSNKVHSTFSHGKEVATPEAATGLLEDIIDDMSASENSNVSRDSYSAQSNGKVVDSFTFQDPSQVASLDLARVHALPHKSDLCELGMANKETVGGNLPVSSTSPPVTRILSQEPAEQAMYSRRSSASNDSLPRSSNRINMGDHTQNRIALRQDVMDGVRYVEPTYDEIDAVIKHLDQDGEHGISIARSPNSRERHRPSSHHEQSPREALQETVSRQLMPNAKIRSDGPSPSPNRLREPFQYLPPTDTDSVDSAAVRMVANNAQYSPSYRPSRHSPRIMRLNSRGSTPPSDWNDGFSSIDEDRFKSRTAFFDQKVNDIVGDVVQKRLSPLEATLSSIQANLAQFLKDTGRTAVERRTSSGAVGVENSDADDEDDTERPLQSRLRSPIRNRKYDELKTSITDIAVAQQNLAPASKVQELLDAVRELKTSVSQTSRAATPVADTKHMIDETSSRQSRGRSAQVISSSQAVAAEKSQLKIAGLESMLKIAEDRAEDEMKARRATEDALADNQRLLRQALHETAQQRESAEATEAKLQEYHEERHQHLKHIAVLEGSQESSEKTSSDLAEKNNALESTLAEYRLSHDQWRRDTDSSRHENRDLNRNLQALKIELDCSHKEIHTMRSKFSEIQDEVASGARNFATDQSRWRSKDDEQRSRLELLTTRLEAEGRTRERLEVEVEHLEAQEQESMKARFQAEQTQQANVHLNKLVGQLRLESHEHQNSAARLKRELHAAKETGIMEVHRIRSAMETDIKASKRETEIMKAEFQETVSRLNKQLEEAADNADKRKAIHELELKKIADSSDVSLQRTINAHEKVLQEHYSIHEQSVQELKAQHQRALGNVVDDKQRSETFLGNRLSLADERLVHLQDKVGHLEEKLEIAKSAAHAAVQTIQSNKTGASSSAPQAPVTKASDIPEKISPQALRESIIVLQEQLQARESKIEELESKLAAINIDAPAKLKDAETEISWLRELLGVRLDDLQDIINTLTQPRYDRAAVRDAAIRLQANLQMEQQEKERALAGGQAFPSLSNIANLASSPKTLPMAAAAAWGNWRRSREPGHSNLRVTLDGDTSHTPSKSSSSPQNFFAGLMTPPSTNMRATPQLSDATSRPASQRPYDQGPRTPRQSMSSLAGSPSSRSQQQDPVTPPLLQKSNYDLDAAEAAVFGEEHSDEHTDDGYAQGDYEVAEEEEPFGPRIGTFA